MKNSDISATPRTQVQRETETLIALRFMYTCKTKKWRLCMISYRNLNRARDQERRDCICKYSYRIAIVSFINEKNTNLTFKKVKN